MRIIWRANQDRARAAVFDQPDTAQDQRAHDDLTDLRRSDYQGAQIQRIERKQGSAVTTGSHRGGRRKAVNLADFSRELPCALGGDWRFLVKAIPAQNIAELAQAPLTAMADLQSQRAPSTNAHSQKPS